MHHKILGKLCIATLALVSALNHTLSSADTSEDVLDKSGDVNTMSFAPVAVPTTDAEKRQNRASSEVTIDEISYPIAYHSLIRTNDTLPLLGGASDQTSTFGTLIDKNGKVITDNMGKPQVCKNLFQDGSGSGPDHTSMLVVGGSLFAVTQLECPLGGAYVTKLDQKSDGSLTAVATRTVDFSDTRGTYENCAGMTTPWNTHLGSEEYEVPMINFNPHPAIAMDWFDEGTSPDHTLRIKAIADYNGLINDAVNASHFGYFSGWVPEITVINENGETNVKKHYAMGRFSHELAYVMPDERTVYLSDDGVNVGLFMFVADAPRDLSSGTLYAAKWIQESAVGAGSATLSWINLGHATSAQIDALLNDNNVTFDVMWEKIAPDAENKCPIGYTSTNTGDAGYHCIKLKSGTVDGISIELAASRLETRLYAAYRGATTEFRKEEGITFNPDDGILYVAMAEITKGMLDNDPAEVGSPNHIKLGSNKCGAVYGLDVIGSANDSDGKAIVSKYVVGNMYGVVAGAYLGTNPYQGTAYEAANNNCSINSIASPDNISYLPKYGVLLIGEDTNYHQNDFVWAYRVKRDRLERLATTPYGSEATSLFWHANIGGYGYITMVTQHPYGESDTDKANSDTTLMESYVGYLGPFPPLDTPQSTKAILESPSQGSFESGIGLIRGWVCQANKVEVQIDDQAAMAVAFGTIREDTKAICNDDGNNGFGLTFNWNLLGTGSHTLRALVDGVEFANVSFTVTTLGVEYLTGANGEFSIPDFPNSGNITKIRWVEPQQNFVIAGTSRSATNEQPVSVVPKADALATLESPQQSSFESGIGLIRGWACQANKIEIQIDGKQRLPVAYGTIRTDTQSQCGDDGNNGFGLTINWNLFGSGSHNLKAFADDVQFGNVDFTVTTLGAEYLTGISGNASVTNFPQAGQTTKIRWAEPHQNFVIVP